MSRQFTIDNNCNYSVWIDTLPSMDLALFEIRPGEEQIINADDSWRGFFFTRTHCSTDSSSENFSCLTGDCNTGTEACNGRRPQTPFTAVKFLRLRGQNTLDYGVNLEHGFNVPIKVAPRGGPGDCVPADCGAKILEVCPENLQLKGPDGAVIGCKSECDAFGDPKVCCTGEYEGRDKCHPSDSAILFKKTCPKAHAWSTDDWIYPCEGASFDMTLCP